MLPTAVASAARRSRSIGRTLCRDMLDEYLCGFLAPGNRLEFFSGLCTPAEVDRAISAQFRGELDLALCHSEALATFLDLSRGDQLRHLHWPSLLHPVPQFLKVTITCSLHAIRFARCRRRQVENWRPFNASLCWGMACALHPKLIVEFDDISVQSMAEIVVAFLLHVFLPIYVSHMWASAEMTFVARHRFPRKTNGTRCQHKLSIRGINQYGTIESRGCEH